MLTAIRKKSKGWVAYLIVGILIIPFSLFGIQQYLAPSANTSIASVDGEDIDMNMYYQELDVTQRYYQQRLAADYTQEFDDAIKQNILEKIINMKLLENFANSINIVTTDEEVRKVIRADKTFQIDGEFSNEQYIRNLRLMRYTLESYETFQSKILSYNQILKNLSESSFWSDIQIEQINNLFSQQREVSYIALTTEKYEDQISVSQSDISDYFNANNSNFLEGPKVKVDFVELSLENIDEPEDADNETLQSLYDENSELYTNPERRRAQHILVEGEDLAKDLLEQIKQGADFVELANTNSIDTSSNEQGGDLGLFEIEHMVPEFGKVVFEMNVGNISEVVKTDYGYHIIKLNEIQQSTLQSFEEVREQLVALYKNEAKQKILFDLEEEFANLAYEESLDMLADQLDLEIQTSDFFSSGELPTSLGTIELSNSNATTILSAAFSEGVIEEGENSDVIELDQNNFVVLSLSSLQPERQKELNEVEAQIIATLKTLGAKKLIDNLSLSIVSALTSGDELTVNKLLTDNELEWNDEGWISRTTQLPFDITNIAYTIPKPILGEHTYSSKSVDNSTSLVIDLKAVRLPEGENDTGISELYLSQENNEMFVSLIKQLRENAEIKVFSDLL